MDTIDLLNRLKFSISPAEREMLEAGTLSGISAFNRATILRMLVGEYPAETVDFSRVKELEAALTDYLNRYMTEAPAVHKWIVIACLFLTFVAREPMHPQGIVGWKQTEAGYQCPAREADGVCRWCVCR